MNTQSHCLELTVLMNTQSYCLELTVLMNTQSYGLELSYLIQEALQPHPLTPMLALNSTVFTSNIQIITYKLTLTSVISTPFMYIYRVFSVCTLTPQWGCLLPPQQLFKLLFRLYRAASYCFGLTLGTSVRLHTFHLSNCSNLAHVL